MEETFLKDKINNKDVIIINRVEQVTLTKEEVVQKIVELKISRSHFQNKLEETDSEILKLENYLK